MKQTKQPSREEELTRLKETGWLKPAAEITAVDDLQFELGRLRTYLEMFNTTIQYRDEELDKTFTFSLMVDPLNRQVSLVRNNDEK